MSPPEGDRHFKAKTRALSALSSQEDEDRLRFYAGTAMLLESDELIVRVQEMSDRAQRRAEEEGPASRGGGARGRAVARGARATQAVNRRAVRRPDLRPRCTDVKSP
jgi:hypothetical protein